MNSRQLLEQHPSVQDLRVSTSGVNIAKASYHNRLINTHPLEDVTRPGDKKFPKGQNVVVERLNQNFRVAAQQLAGDSTQGSSSRPPMKQQPQQQQQGIGSNVPVPKEIRPKESKRASSSLAGKEGQERKSSAAGGGSARSLVSTVVSFDADSDASSFSMYSCSCCHVKPPSSRASSVCSSCAVNPSDYDNLTSISQRIQPSGASVCSSVRSSKLHSIEQELEKEKEDRMKTQKELENIKKRQTLLLSKLSEKERNELEKLMAGGA